MSSESECDFHRFFAAAAVGEAVPKRINDTLIRERFGGTILPIAPVRVQPLDEASPWWSHMTQYIRNLGSFEAERRGLKIDAWMERALEVARSLFERGLTTEDDLKAEGEEANSNTVRKFLTATLPDPAAHGARVPRRGLCRDRRSQTPPPKKWPAGLQQWPSQFPRLFVGLTQAASPA